jgi:Tfp pilus assembly protein PilF
MDFEQALTLRPGYAEAILGLGCVFDGQHDSKSAIKYFQKAVEAIPAYPGANNNLGVLSWQTEHHDEAWTGR